MRVQQCGNNNERGRTGSPRASAAKSFGWPVTQPIAAHENASAAIGLDAVARREISRAVGQHDLPVSPRQDTALQAFCAIDASADDVDHPPIAVWCPTKEPDIGKLRMDAKDGLAGDRTMSYSAATPCSRASACAGCNVK